MKDSGPRTWAMWTAVLPALIGAAVAAVLGSVGTTIVGIGVDSNCTDMHSCGIPCQPCAAEQGWINAGFIGQGILIVAAILLITMGVSRPRWRKASAVGGAALLPLSITWICVTTVLAQNSF